MSKLLILGAGQYGMVVREIALATKQFGEIAFLDDNSDKAIGKISNLADFKTDFDCAFVAIGDRDVRKRLFSELKKNGFDIPDIISPMAYVSPSAVLGKGVIVEPMAVIHTDCTIGDGCFICAGAVINHNSTIEQFCQVNCGAVIAARQTLPEKSILHYNKVFQQ